MTDPAAPPSQPTYQPRTSAMRDEYKRRFHGQSSHYPGFYQLSPHERRQLTAAHSQVTEQDLAGLEPSPAKLLQVADTAVENAIGTLALPLGIATNLKLQDLEPLVPMCTEEPSVIAAVSHGAKLARSGGGFFTYSAASGAMSTGQIQLRWSHPPPDQAHRTSAVLTQAKPSLLHTARHHLSTMTKRGGGITDLSWRWLDATSSLLIHLEVNTVDAMGANTINTLCEVLAQDIHGLFPEATLGLRILTNLALGRLTRAECRIPATALGRAAHHGHDVAHAIAAASEFSQHDIYRACTHNKGIMNGITAVGLATGNDTRALEAAAHAYAAAEGTYQPLSRWHAEPASQPGTPIMLHGELNVPIPTGVIGGMTRYHPTAQAALKILGSPSAVELAEIMAAVGLAANLAALIALTTEGIQAGHMKLHHKKTQGN